MKKSKSEIKYLIKLNILKTDPSAAVVLFGSQARGDENQNSDWDLLILTNHSTSLKDEQKFMDNLYELELELEEVFSPLIYSMNDWKTKYLVTPLYENVLKEGIEL